LPDIVKKNLFDRKLFDPFVGDQLGNFVILLATSVKTTINHFFLKERVLIPGFQYSVSIGNKEAS